MFLHPRETPKKVNPEPLPRHNKYSGKNSIFIPSHPCQSSLAKPEVIDSPLNSKIVSKLQSILSTGLADSSWSKYKTAYNHLKSVERDTGRDMSLPLSEQSVLWYVSYISTTRDVTAKTIEGYIHGLKMLHLAVGIHIPSLNSPLVNLALNWQKSFAIKSDIF